MDLRAKSADLSPTMKPPSASSGVRPRPSNDTPVTKPAHQLPARVLVVEDQEDLRRMVATALEIEGYDVDEASNALEGLRCLERDTYQLVLSDYAMPGGTGAWMLQEAARRGLMGAAASVLVTAHPDVRDLADIAVINKPLDLDSFLDHVRRLVSANGTEVHEQRAVHQKLELVLYISSRSPASRRAKQTLERFLADVQPGQVGLTVIDLVEQPLAGEADRIAFTPTLVRRHPGPRAWIVGSLRDASVLRQLLRASGVGIPP